MTKGCLACIIAGALWLSAAEASRAALIISQTPVGATQAGAPVSARATLTTGTNTISIVLENLTVDPPSAAQCLSGFEFHLDTGQSSGTLTSSQGLDRAVNSDGTFTDGGLVAMGWALNTVGSDLKLDLLGTPTAPSHQIIGPPDPGSNLYTGNPSVTGNSHQPHSALSATFDLSVPGVTADSTVTSAIFQFNTSPGSTNTGMFVIPVPEPATCSLMLAGAALLVRRRRKLHP